MGKAPDAVNAELICLAILLPNFCFRTSRIRGPTQTRDREVSSAAPTLEDLAHRSSRLIHLFASFNPQTSRVDEENVLLRVKYKPISKLH